MRVKGRVKILPEVSSRMRIGTRDRVKVWVTFGIRFDFDVEKLTNLGTIYDKGVACSGGIGFRSSSEGSRTRRQNVHWEKANPGKSITQYCLAFHPFTGVHAASKAVGVAHHQKCDHDAGKINYGIYFFPPRLFGYHLTSCPPGFVKTFQINFVPVF